MSSSFNQSSSTSSTFPIETAENGIMDQIAQTAAGMAGSLYNWAGNVFSQTSAITNQAVGNFFTTSANMLGLSQNLTNQYNNLFAPENAQLVADANSYASPARMAVDMGMAGATQAQAGNDALANSEEVLRSFGIDPSAGRYAALDQASRVQNAANVAGAENQQRMADIQTGQALRNKAVDVGAQLPAAIANVNNTAIQANTGASNAELANANTGANLYGLADKYLGTGMQLKLPFSGSKGMSQSSGNSSKDGNSGSGGSGGAGNSGAGGGGSSGQGGYNGMAPNTSAMGTGGGAGGRQPGSSITHPDPGPDTGGGPGGPGPDAGVDQVNTGDVPWWTQTGPDATGGPGADNPWGSQPNNPGSWDPSQTDNSNIPQDWTDPTQTPDPSVWQGGGDQSAPPIDTSSLDQYNGDPFSGGGGGGDQSAPVDTSGGDQSAPIDTSGGDTGGDFARGGAVPSRMPMRRLSSAHMAPSYAQGGSVPTSASPSRGARVDDVPVQTPAGGGHLNAHEFVIPQDVALWKGQEFFQKLINQSRMARHGAPAKPTMG